MRNKKIIFTILLVALSVSACSKKNKSNTAAPQSFTETTQSAESMTKVSHPKISGSYRCYGTKYSYNYGDVQSETTTQYLYASTDGGVVKLSGFSGCAVIMNKAFGLSENGISCANDSKTSDDGGATLESRCDNSQSTKVLKVGDDSNYNGRLLSLSDITTMSFTLTTAIEIVRSGSMQKAQLTLNCNKN